jgi:hypothetical protein
LEFGVSEKLKPIIDVIHLDFGAILFPKYQFLVRCNKCEAMIDREGKDANDKPKYPTIRTLYTITNKITLTTKMNYLTPTNAAKTASIVALVHGAAHFVRPRKSARKLVG